MVGLRPTPQHHTTMLPVKGYLLYQEILTMAITLLHPGPLPLLGVKNQLLLTWTYQLDTWFCHTWKTTFRTKTVWSRNGLHYVPMKLSHVPRHSQPCIHCNTRTPRHHSS